MKKMIIALAVVLAGGFAFTSNSAFAWGHGQGQGRGMANGYMMNGGGYGMGNHGGMMKGYNAAVYNSPEYKKFLEETSDIRISLRGDRAEMRALMAGTNPDAKRVRVLAENISKKETELSNKAAGSNLPYMPMFGRGGVNCPGYGRR